MISTASPTRSSKLRRMADCEFVRGISEVGIARRLILWQTRVVESTATCGVGTIPNWHPNESGGTATDRRTRANVPKELRMSKKRWIPRSQRIAREVNFL